jgi:hypothetical protein
VRVRSEQDPREPQRQFTVLTFRVQRFDQAGNELAPVPVQLTGWTLEGAISEGDWVEVSAAGPPSGTLHVDQVRNLTTGAKEESHSVGYWVLRAGIIAIVIAIFVGAVIVMIIAFASFGQ